MDSPLQRSAPQPLVSLHGEDTGTAIASLAGMYAGRSWYSRSVGTPYWFRYVAIGDGCLSIRRSQMHGYLRGSVATEGEVVVQWLESGSARVDVRRDETRMVPGVPVVFPIERRFEMEYEDWDQRLVHISKDLLLDVAAERYVATWPLAFDVPPAPDPDLLSSWQRTVAGAVLVFRTDGPGSLAWHEARRDVVRSFLRLHPLRAERSTDVAASRSRAHLDAALDFLHQHAHEPLTVADVARGTGLSVRGLQDLFHRTLARSPMEYLRELRLSKAHEELRALTPEDVSVGEVARSWGFAHLGRFAAEHARHFGEYPSRTLRSR